MAGISVLKGICDISRKQAKKAEDLYLQKDSENSENDSAKQRDIDDRNRKKTLIENTQTIVSCTPTITNGDEIGQVSINGTNKTLYAPRYTLTYNNEGELLFGKKVNNTTSYNVISNHAVKQVILSSVSSSTSGFTATSNLTASQIKSLVTTENKYICFYNSSASYIFYPNHLDLSGSTVIAYCSGYINSRYKDIKIVVNGSSVTATYKNYTESVVPYNITLASGYSSESGALNIANYNPTTGLVDLHFAVRGTIRAEDHVTIATIPSIIAPSTFCGKGNDSCGRPCYYCHDTFNYCAVNNDLRNWFTGNLQTLPVQN